jgi:putative ABC transport system permease protein
MLRNYLLIAIRNIFRQKAYSLINIIGLAVGIMSCMLIVMYVADELSYDKFHTKGDRIYRLFFNYTSPNGESFNHAIGPYRLADELAARYPEIEEAVRLSFTSPMPLRNGEIEFVEDNVMFADSNVFKVFTIQMEAGDPSTALTEPFTCVVSDVVARKFFGEDNPVGRSLQVNTGQGEGEVRITGVFRSFPENSHIKPDVLASMSTAEYLFNDRQKYNWGEGTVAYYLLLPEGLPKESLEAKFPELITEIFDDEEATNYVHYWLQPLYDTYLKSDLRFDFEPHGNLTTVIVFSMVALFILIIATINYMNLATARSARRAREVGLRKLVGGQRHQLVRQFLVESISLVFVAMVIALILATFLLPFFNTISGKTFENSALLNWKVILILLLSTVVIGIMAGSYPSFVLASFKPLRVLYGDTRTGKGGFTLRKILVVLQFSISIALIISTLVVYSQWNLLSNKDLGINPENVVIIPRPSQGYNTFKEEVLKNPQVLYVTSSNKRPAGRLTSNLGYTAEGLPEDEGKSIKIVTVDFDFFETLENRIVAGRSFSNAYGMDSVSSFILNETAVRDIGWEDPIGKWFQTSTLDPETDNWKTRRGIVVGVAEDFNFESVHNTIQPVCFFVDNYWINWMSVKISGTEAQATLDFLESEFHKVDPESQFDYSFYEDEIASLYTAERQFLRLFIIFALLAILIASLGILGLASFSVEQRTREIGIRKVAGSSEKRIILLISNEFSILVLIANLIAWPVAWYFMRNWLMDFPYRIKLGIPLFLLSALLALVIAMLTVFFQGWRAANLNPAEALRHD